MENKTKTATKRTTSDSDAMDRNKATLAKVFQALEDGTVEDLDNLLEENVIEHTPDPALKGTGREYVKQLFNIYRTAFPDLKVTINDLIAEDDRVVCYTTMSGTNTGKFMNKMPTNKTVVFDQIDICKFRNGKVAEHWGIGDNLSMLMQLGVVPPMG